MKLARKKIIKYFFRPLAILSLLISLSVDNVFSKTLEGSSPLQDLFDLQYEMAFRLYGDSLSQAIVHAQEAATIALQMKNVEALGKANWMCGWLFRRQGDLANAFNYYLGARDAYARLKNHNKVEQLEENLGSVAFDNGSFKTALKLLTKRLNTAKKLDSKRVAAAHFDISLAHKKIGQLDSANIHLLRSRILYEREYRREDSTALARVFNELGIIQFQLGKDLNQAVRFDSARLYYKRASEMDGTRLMTAMASNNIGKTFLEQEAYNLATDHLRKALALNVKAGNKRLQVSNLINLGKVYYHLNLNDSSTQLFNRSIELNIGFDDPFQNHRDLSRALEINQNFDLYVAHLYLDSLHERDPSLLVNNSPTKRLLRFNQMVATESLFTVKENQSVIDLSYEKYEEEHQQDKLIANIKIYGLLIFTLILALMLVYRVIKWLRLRKSVKDEIVRLEADRKRISSKF